MRDLCQPVRLKNVYTTRMEPSANSELIASTMAERAAEIEDFERVVELYSPSIFRFLLASVRDRDAAECLTQDCLLRAYRKRHEFRAEAAIKTWLMQIAVNLVRDQKRNRRLQFWRRTQLFRVDPQDVVDYLAKPEVSPEERLVLHEQVRAIWDATGDLSERQRAVFLLRFVEDMDVSEIAQVLGTREGTIKKHLFRAVHKVRERIRRGL
jgi:RNA polymerase sigma-70 factor (ECF subfamily)